jgi:hypothetical protein
MRPRAAAMKNKMGMVEKDFMILIGDKCII